MVRKALKNMLRLGKGVHDLINSPVYREEEGGLTHTKNLIYCLDILYNGPTHSWHKLTQFIPEIFMHVHLCNLVHENECSALFFIIRRVSPLPSLFMPHDDIIEKWQNISLSRLKGYEFPLNVFETMRWHVFIFPSILSNPRNN